ncbi:hypothetical protein [Candidatus Lokiarchaeum ossiferum]|uniref:hypothetical protein n=1 Tax=Candidatus Lokiarchaeum ossiferum TaxID=2951803 RepID=UPI00352C648E
MNHKDESGLEFVKEPPSDLGPYERYIKFVDYKSNKISPVAFLKNLMKVRSILLVRS